MLSYDLLDLNGGDIFAARDDNVFGTVAQFDVAIQVPDANIAGVEPAASEGSICSLWIVVIALGHVITAHHDLTHTLRVTWHVLHLDIDDARSFSGNHTLALARL